MCYSDTLLYLFELNFLLIIKYIKKLIVNELTILKKVVDNLSAKKLNHRLYEILMCVQVRKILKQIAK